MITPPNRLHYLLHTLSGLHIGCGQGKGDVDLPVIRGATITRPIVPGSSLKGALKAQWPMTSGAERTWLFGPDKHARPQQGMLAFDDARLLLLPVASMAGGWAWVSTANTLKRFASETGLNRLFAALPDEPEKGSAWVSPKSALKWNQVASTDAAIANNDSQPLLMVHDFLLQPEEEASKPNWSNLLAEAIHPENDTWQDSMQKRLLIVQETVMDALCDLALEVRNRVSLNEDRVAEDKALWREELVPTDSIFWGAVAALPEREGRGVSPSEALSMLTKRALQIGGKASIGHGWVSFEPMQAHAATHGG